MSALVSVNWLEEAVRSGQVGSSLRILDSSWHMPEFNRNPINEFNESHIPGASFFDIDQCCDKASSLAHMLPTEREFSDYVGNLGIGNKTHVVVYDTSDYGSFAAPRVWWMFRLFGHNSVSVLDGGLRKWVQDGHPLTAEYSKPEPAEFFSSLNRSWVKSYDDILENFNSNQFQLVDARPPGRFRGIEPEPLENVEPGHIPRSINMPFYSFLAPSGEEWPIKDLAAMFEEAKVDLKRPVCATCTSGVTACHVVLAAHLCGHPGAFVYDGSWSDWYARAPPELMISEAKGKHA